MLKQKTLGVKVQRLFWDIEVSHNVVLAFRAGYDQHIRPESILVERKIICISYKWQNEKEVHVLTWDKDQMDEGMLKAFLRVSQQADEMVAHHGDRYDMPFFKTRCLINKLEPVPAWKTIDTCAWAKRNFLFNSNALDYISKVLGHGGKDKMELDDWKDILLHNDREKLSKMARYCKTDVRKLEKVYLDMAPNIRPKSHVGVLAGLDKWTCPRTGSKDVSKSKTKVTANGTVQHQMLSNAVGGGYYTISNSAYESYLEYRKKEHEKRLQKVRIPASKVKRK